MKERRFCKILLLCWFTVLLPRCGKTADQMREPPDPAASRIISAAPSNTEIIAGLGLADRLVAVDKYSRSIEGVRRDLPEIDFFYPDVEAVVRLNPDIIITGEINSNGDLHTPYRSFERLGIRMFQIPTSRSVEEIYDSIVRIARVLGAEERGEKLVRDMKSRIETITARAVPGRRSVYFEISPAPNMVSFGRGTYLNELIEMAGARNIFADEERWFTPGAEAVILANPGVILTLAGKDAVEEIKNRPGFGTVDAVRHNRVYAVDADRASRPSQNIVLALEEIYREVWK